MTPKAKEHIKIFMVSILTECDYVKSLDLDQFTIMRISLIYSIADQIAKHMEV